MLTELSPDNPHKSLEGGDIVPKYKYQSVDTAVGWSVDLFNAVFVAKLSPERLQNDSRNIGQILNSFAEKLGQRLSREIDDQVVKNGRYAYPFIHNAFTATDCNAANLEKAVNKTLVELSLQKDTDKALLELMNVNGLSYVSSVSIVSPTLFTGKSTCVYYKNDVNYKFIKTIKSYFR
jgi:hypothetical protein